MDNADLLAPIAVLLKQGTAKAHEQAENSQGAISLARGELEKDEYIRFLMMMFTVYSTLERALDVHSSNLALAPIYAPNTLYRASRISADIAHLLGTPDWKTHPSYTTLQSNPPAPLRAYVNRILECDETGPYLLLSHAYVRYLGDLSGGQFIRRKIAKAYKLEGDGGRGTQFYEFESLDGNSEHASQADMKKIKDWFRAGMNQGIGDDAEKKVLLVEEAQLAFLLNQHLFTVLRLPKGTIPNFGPLAASPPTPTIQSDDEDDEPREIPVQIGQRVKGDAYSVQSVVALILAACLTHFVLVVGGYTGKGGEQKLQAVLQWLGNLAGVSPPAALES